MAWRIDPYDNSIVLDGHEKGIGDSPYDGISNMRNVDITAIPGEASVGLSVSCVTSLNTGFSGTVTSADPATDIVTLTISSGSLTTGTAIIFAGGGLPTGITAGTVYWVSLVTSTTFKLYNNPYGTGTVINITATGTGTWTSPQIGVPTYFTTVSGITGFGGSIPFCVDNNGLVWGTTSITTDFVYLGNATTIGAGITQGNGIIAFRASDYLTSFITYLFVFRNSAIDFATLYLPSGTSPTATITWTYGWKPSDASTGNAPGYMKSTNSAYYNHEAILAPDNKVYYCDSNYIGRFYQADPAVPFVPTTLATYVFDQTQVLPFNDVAQCLAPLGNNLLVGGKLNVVYPWDTFSSLPNYPILVPEFNMAKMVTVNTNTFIFCGTKGRIYYTNGSQVGLFKKIPDHIGGREKYNYIWGGATSNKNQLYFGVLAQDYSSATGVTAYGGLWAIDLDTKALRLVNKLSYGTYAGYASAVVYVQPSSFNSFPPAAGYISSAADLYIGWVSANSGGYSGIDKTIGTAYTNSEATIDYDLIPIGTYDKPREFARIEYKLTRPLVSGESIVLKQRLIFNNSDTGYTTVLSDSTVGNYSLSGEVNFKNAQWLQIQAILNTVNTTSASYTRLKEIRIKGISK